MIDVRCMYRAECIKYIGAFHIDIHILPGDNFAIYTIARNDGRKLNVELNYL